MGEQLPQLRSVQLIMADESQSLVSATLEYEGGIKCRAEAMLTALNLQIQITVSIPLIKGSLAIRSNTTHLQVCFNEAPLIELRMRFKAGSFVSPKVCYRDH
ncbi:hypothetical protein SARC_03577 [Sphaeroforma arctica JP610]|uniref:Uncharacterized protein n=1 Tax=Sphaeroforma arctica JP610 TaxID=667725 RepID=A0A0L0G572_9EUKA|nr:hypothetical protein SARC_03577 [Sphaeroforma arctica JP610]KNC84187.1 hypothetical protein SARC_03577 [Sphaeroforma arctica JP610]|eukprot:XP_014158089.1 hypothetical protein SARC_03577 [Sphaeroforma arctica JP610]